MHQHQSGRPERSGTLPGPGPRVFYHGGGPPARSRGSGAAKSTAACQTCLPATTWNRQGSYGGRPAHAERNGS
jgi:hypothetical protein